MTVKLFAKWLLDNFPHDAQLVTINTCGWFNEDIERVKMEDLPRQFYIVENPTKKGQPIKTDKKYLVIYDEKLTDY
jgi:hypothetical protein